MQPTNKLRFVTRKISEVVESFGSAQITREIVVKVLQQWWEETFVEENGYVVTGEWRDVPLELEGE